MTTIHLFPGQGSQKVGMGAELFDRFPEQVAEADAVLGYSLARLCLEDPQQQLSQTQFTQPALYTVNALTHRAKLEDGDAPPDFVAGHSLGEYNALLAADVFDFATGLRLVQRRGAIMSQAEGGGMAAVLGLDAERIRAALDEAGLAAVDIANYNSPTQTVVSGRKTDIDQAVPALGEAGAKRVIPLPVSGAFHSRYMSPAAEEFGRFLEGFEFQQPRLPVIANVDAEAYTGDDVATKLQAQIDHSVRWTDTIRYLQQQHDPEFTEVGPGKVLAGLLRQIK